MKALSLATGLAITLAVPMIGGTQVATPAPAALAQWTFDAEVGGWQSTDPAVPPTITADANVIRDEEAGGVLEYQYTPQMGGFAGISTPVQAGLGGGNSLRYWLKTTDYALIATVLTEVDGSTYTALMTSLPGAWQEVALSLAEFSLGDDSSDENGRLDPEQVTSVALADIVGFLAQAAMQETFIVAPEMGPRLLWLDDFQVTTETVQPRWQATEIEGRRAVRLDSFESSPLQWHVIAGKGIEVAYDQDHVAEGEFSLRITYDLPPGKLIGALTGLTEISLTGMTRLSLSVMSEMPTTLLVQLKERDESEYNTMFEMQAGDALQRVEIALADLALGDDSSDENGRLDLDQVTEMVVVDASLMTENPVQLNTLWIDDVVFSE